jgi:hypothetical protein
MRTRTSIGECPAGRPFLVDRIARVASVTERSDWSCGRAPDVGSLTHEARRALAAHWTNVGLMEHASVAAFARFTMELAALGAGAELVSESARAMSDEIEHAKLAFALASAYAGEAIGPGALDVRGATSRRAPHASDARPTECASRPKRSPPLRLHSR